jgi:hypothetical protein
MKQFHVRKLLYTKVSWKKRTTETDPLQWIFFDKGKDHEKARRIQSGKNIRYVRIAKLYGRHMMGPPRPCKGHEFSLLAGQNTAPCSALYGRRTAVPHHAEALSSIDPYTVESPETSMLGCLKVVQRIPRSDRRSEVPR